MYATAKKWEDIGSSLGPRPCTSADKSFSLLRWLVIVRALVLALFFGCIGLTWSKPLSWIILVTVCARNSYSILGWHVHPPSHNMITSSYPLSPHGFIIIRPYGTMIPSEMIKHIIIPTHFIRIQSGVKFVIGDHTIAVEVSNR